MLQCDEIVGPFGYGCVERDSLSEAVVSLRTAVTFVTWLISRTEFSSSELVVRPHFFWTSIFDETEGLDGALALALAVFFLRSTWKGGWTFVTNACVCVCVCVSVCVCVCVSVRVCV